MEAKRSRGRPSEQFCKRGHNKYAPYGIYIQRSVKNNYEYIYEACAECRRARGRISEKS